MHAVCTAGKAGVRPGRPVWAGAAGPGWFREVRAVVSVPAAAACRCPGAPDLSHHRIYSDSDAFHRGCPVRPGLVSEVLRGASTDGLPSQDDSVPLRASSGVVGIGLARTKRMQQRLGAVTPIACRDATIRLGRRNSSKAGQGVAAVAASGEGEGLAISERQRQAAPSIAGRVRGESPRYPRRSTGWT